MTAEICVNRPGEDVTPFLDFPDRLYAGDRGWAPPLRRESVKRFSATGNPYFDHAEAAIFTARRHGEVVGRCTAQVDHEHLRTHRDATGFFGCLDTIDDARIAADLLDAASDWCRERGMTRIRGPFSLSVNEEIGVMIHGFDEPSVMLTPYHRPCQAGLVEQAGFHGVKEVINWRYRCGPLPPRAAKARDMTAALEEVRIRPIDKSRLGEDMKIVRDIFNDAWQDNWGFVSWTDSEFARAVEEFRMILDERLAFIAEIDGEPVGMVICLPNLNEAIADFEGRLGPLNLGKLLWRVKVRNPRTAKLPLLGLRKSIQRNRRYAGLATAMCVAVSEGLCRMGVEWAELGWTLDDNHLVNSVISRMGGEAFKRHRIYEKALQGPDRKRRAAVSAS